MAELTELIEKTDLAIPSLDSILPNRWDPYSNDQHDEINESLAQLNLPNYHQMSAQDKITLVDVTNQVRVNRQQRLENARKILGVDNQTLTLIAEEIEALHGKRFSEYYLRINGYAPVVSFLTKLFGEDMRSRNIVEIGTGNDGIAMLGYFSRKGARCYGLDSESTPKDEKLKEHNVQFIKDRWENIALHFEPLSVDAIYLQYMHPNPDIDSPLFNNEAYTNQGVDGMRKRIEEKQWDFQKHVAKEMHKILKPNGVFALRELDQFLEERSEFIAYETCFTQNGFTLHKPKLEKFGRYLHIFQKTN